MNKDDVKKIADLARIELSDKEAESLAEEFDSILGYIKQIESMPSYSGLSESKLKNVMREDGDPHAPAEYTEAILSNAPARVGDFVKVKKILG